MKIFWRSWILLGRVLFVLTWPLLFLYLRRGSRTRVIILCEGKIMVVKGWLGSGRWVLPGGGLHSAESPAMGAVREIYEETGVVIPMSSLKQLGVYRVNQGLRFRYTLFTVELDAVPELRIRGPEIVDVAWVEPHILHDIRQAEPAARDSVAVWLQRTRLVH